MYSHKFRLNLFRIQVFNNVFNSINSIQPRFVTVNPIRRTGPGNERDFLKKVLGMPVVIGFSNRLYEVRSYTGTTLKALNPA